MVRMIALAAALLAGVFVASTAAAQQFPPNRFFGTVTVNGQAASTGTTVTAKIGDTDCGTTTVTSGGNYVIDVPGVTINPNCGRNGQSTVTFQVGSQTAAQTATRSRLSSASKKSRFQALTATAAPSWAATKTRTTKVSPQARSRLSPRQNRREVRKNWRRRERRSPEAGGFMHRPRKPSCHVRTGRDC